MMKIKTKITMELKYIKTIREDIVIFSTIIDHSDFKFLNPVSAGFCRINAVFSRVDCYGESYSLGLESDKREDSLACTKEVFGADAYLDLIKKLK